MTIMLITHIVLMSISLVATTGMVIASLCNIIVSRKIQLLTLIATVAGVILGASLLIIHPIGSRCLELTSYMIVFYFAYRYATIRSQSLAAAPLTSK